MKSELTVYTGGTFDVPHIGHAKFLQLCREYFPNCYLVVALNTDEFVKEFKGKPPLFSYKEREGYLKLTGFVDEVIPNECGSDSKPAILRVKPDVIAIGMDWLEKDYCKQMNFTSEWLTSNGITLAYIPRPGGLSTSLIKERIKNAG